MVTRICENESWKPERFKCSNISQIRRCPLNFEETSKTCQFISSPRPWSNICTLETLTEPTANTTLENEFVWVPYKRFSKYGPYEAVSWGEDRGKHFDKDLVASIADPDFFNKECLIINTTSEEYFPEFCFKEHRHVCAFNKKEANERCPKNCVSADILSERCYCKKEGFYPSKLTKIETIFDLTVLKDLVKGDECYVSSDLPYVSSKPQALSDKAWFYTDKSLQCSLCTVNILKTISNEEVEMVLNFDDNQIKLSLTIYNPESLFDKASEKTIYCYTDAAQYDLKKRLTVDIVIEYRATLSYNVYEINLEDKYIGNYWCEAYKDINEENVVYSNRVLAYKEKTGNEFSLRVTIKSFCILFPCSYEHSIKYDEVFKKVSLDNLKSEIRVMDIIHFDFESIDLLLHITTNHNQSVMDDFYQLKSELDNLTQISMNTFTSSEYCLPETDDNNLTWPLTRIGQGAVANDMCLQENGLPVVRICEGKFLYGGEWGKMLGECHQDVQVPDSSKYIKSTLNQNISQEIVSNVTSVINADPDLPVLSVYMVSKFMDNMYSQLNNSKFDGVSSTLEITDSLLNINKQSLISAQELLNVSDDLLDLVDNILTESNVQSNVMLLQKNNLIIHISNPLLSGVSGLVVYEQEGKPLRIESLARNTTFESLESDVLIAMIVPEEIFNHLNSSNITIITTLYFKDSFFESNYTKKPSGPVISITIPELGCNLPSTIPILFKVSNYTDQPECGFWDYGKKTMRTKGKWSTVGGNYLGQFENNSLYHICSFSHLTHFSLLRIMLPNEISPVDDRIMDFIFYLGDAITVMGISGIFATAIMFKRWRRKQGTIILLNLSVAILIEVLLMQATDTKILFAPQGCGVLGIFLHYIIISKFCWMLVYSFLQYMRFVRVLSVLPEYIVLKSVIFGWGFAIIPVTIVNIITRSAYTQKKYNFCYPTGVYLYLGTLMPVLIIVCINTYVFIAIMREVTFKNVESHGSKENIHKLQVQLAILLFFVLGVPWLFFVFANLIPVSWIQISLAYFFCVTSNIQGFILFLFYVVFNNETRVAWMTYIGKSRSKSFSISTKLSSRS